MRILVTGHQGYIGSVLTPILIENGHFVVGLDSGLFEGARLEPASNAVPGVRKDIRDVTPDDLEGFDAIIHLAGLPGSLIDAVGWRAAHAINYVAAVRLASIARFAGVRRYVFPSTGAVYGQTGKQPVSERCTPQPNGTHSTLKHLVEQDVMRLADGDFSPTFLRLGSVSGWSPAMRFDLLLNDMVAQAFTRGFVQLGPYAAAQYTPIHVQDVAHAFAAVVEAPPEMVRGKVFNVAQTAEPYSAAELAVVAAAAIPGCSMRLESDVCTDANSLALDGSRITWALPSFKPRWSVHETVAQLHQIYHTLGLTAAQLASAPLERRAHLRHLAQQGLLDRDLRLNTGADRTYSSGGDMWRSCDAGLRINPAD